MKVGACLIFLLFSSFVQATTHGFVEENSLHLFDNPRLTGNIDEDLFQDIIHVAQTSYDAYVQNNHLKPLRISGLWQNSTVNAYTTPQLQVNIITVYGGIARRPELSPDGLALVICHEIGHAYGGRPDKLSPVFRVSVEGQADYYGAMGCFTRIIDQLPQSSSETATAYMQQACAQSSLGAARCERMLLAGQSVGRLLAFIKNQSEPDYASPDPTQVARTLLSYPERIQCRLDTYFRGFLGRERPRCWFKS